MAKVSDNTICILDVGSVKTCVLVGEATDAGLRYRGHGIADSKGSRKGVIVELEKATASIQRAVEQAEAAAEMPIERATIGIGGPHIRGFNSRGGISLGSRPREINRDDVRQAVERARSVSLPPDRQTIHLLPQEFIVDEQGSIQDPAGMIGLRLEVNAHVITAAASATQNLVTAANKAGVHIDDIVFEPLACADATLDLDERELGVCLIDIGAGSTEVVVFYEGAVAHTGVIPIGGDHFTNDVAVGLRTPLTAADKIKRLFGCAVVTRIPEGNEIEVPSVGERPSRLVSQRMLGEILEPRTRELFEMLREQLRQARVFDGLGAGCVLIGGASRLPSLCEIAEQVMRCPARLGTVSGIPRMPSSLAQTDFASCVGLLMYTHRARIGRVKDEQLGIKARLRALFVGA
ncbi:MAG TPA: cell division protein FtsA [Terriglobales bacterium]|jgi:cell division protein FtsA|nr:cell division protein FtsA [Terriglobales bacterium]